MGVAVPVKKAGPGLLTSGVLLLVLLPGCQAWAPLGINCGGNVQKNPSLDIYYDGVDYGPSVIYDPGNNFTDQADGTVYVADSFYTGESTHVMSRVALGQASPSVTSPLYDTERYGMTVEYNIELPADLGSSNKVEVSLFFVEHEFSTRGRRVFSVNINDQLYIDSLDLIASFGQHVEVRKDFVVEVGTSRLLNIYLTSQVYEALINGIRVSPANTSDSNPQDWFPTSFALGKSSGSHVEIKKNLQRGLYSINATFLAGGIGNTVTGFYNFIPAFRGIDLAAVGGGSGSTISIPRTFLCSNGILWMQFSATSGTLQILSITATKVADAMAVAIDSGSPQGNLDNQGIQFLQDVSNTYAIGGTAIYPPASNPYQVFKGNPFASGYHFDWPDFMMSTWREGKSFSYAIPMENTRYVVDLWFTDQLSTAVGQRVFSIAYGSTLAHAGVDIYQLSGGNTMGVIIEDIVTVTSGYLTINFTATTGSALVQGILVYPDVGGQGVSAVAVGSPAPSSVAAPAAPPAATGTNNGTTSGAVIYSDGTWIAPGGGPTTCYQPNPIPKYKDGAWQIAIHMGDTSGGYVTSWGLAMEADNIRCTPDATIGGDQARLPTTQNHCLANIKGTDNDTIMYHWCSETPVTGTSDPSLYHCESIGFNTYKVRVPKVGGTYGVVAYFSERSDSSGVTKEGDRVFMLVYWDTIDMPASLYNKKAISTESIDPFRYACDKKFVADPPVQGIASNVASDVLSIQVYPSGSKDAPIMNALWVYQIA